LQDPDSGTILLNGLDVVANKDAVRRQLGYLPQEFGVYPRISAVDMLHHLAVMKGIHKSGERREIVDALLKQTNLWDARKKALSTYSGGMKQRFGIAQALLANPKLIIVDEPTAGLDPAERNRFLNLLSSLARDVIVILSTHIVEDVRELCPRMAIISNGQVGAGGRAGGDAGAAARRDLEHSGSVRGGVQGGFCAVQVVSTKLLGGAHEIRGCIRRRILGRVSGS
jgi:ABC-2 type transport system ATP-binding protein